MVNVISYAFTIPLIVGGLILVWTICRAKSNYQAIEEKTKAYQAAIPIALVVAATISFWIIDSIRTNPFANFPRPDESFIVTFYTVFLLVPTVGVVCALRNTFSSVRLTSAHSELSTALGILVSLVLLVPTAAFSPLFVLVMQEGGLDAIYLLSYVYAAFCEELLFRGLLQTRLENSLGPRTGLVATAIIFNLYHAPTWILVSSMTSTAFIANVILSLPFAILVGYVAQKSENLLGSTIFHVAYAVPVILLK